MRRKYLLRLLQAGFLSASLCLTGCCGTQAARDERGRNLKVDNCSTIPQGAIPHPPGTYLHAYQDMHAAAAEADDFVIYWHEWHKDVPALSAYGKAHLCRIAERLATVPFPVVIQPDLRPELNAARRLQVVRLLFEKGITDAEERVIIDFPKAEGLYGDEAPRIYRDMIEGGRGGRGGSTSGGFRGGLRGGLGGGGVGGY